MPQIPSRKRLWHTSPWKWLFSLQTGIALLVLVALASIYGTLVNPFEKALALVYHAWWYQILLLALALSIVCTTVRTMVEKTIPSLRIRFRDPRESRAPGRPSLTIPSSGNAEAVAQAFRNRRFGVATQGPLGYAWKGRITRLGSPVSHLGIVIILLGGFLMSWVSREGVVDLAEGEETSEMRLRSAPDQPVSLGFTLRCDDFETGFFPKTRIPSKYISSLTILGSQNAIRTGQVEVNRSMVVNGWKIHQAEFTEIPGASRFLLEVGKKDLPASVTLELSPGQTRALPGMAHAEVSLGGKFPYPWTLTTQDGGKSRGVLFRNAKGLRVRVDGFVADFVMGADRKVTSRSNELNNPAAHITVMEGNKEVLSQWLFAREDLKGMMHRESASAYEFDLAKVSREGTNLRFDLTMKDTREGGSARSIQLGLDEETAIAGDQADSAGASGEKKDLPPEQPLGGAEWRVSVVKTIPAYRTILTLTRNPALPIIYGGCGIVMAGLLLVFLMGRKEIRFRADEQKKLLHVVGIYRHPTEDFDGTTAGILERLRRPEEPAAGTENPLAAMEAASLSSGEKG